jgi:ribonuclease BN (tRNA processing enzyme)
MSTFETIVLGVGDAFSEKYRPTSLLLSCDDFLLAIDCPDMYRSVLRGASERSGRNLSIEKIDHVLITHVHGDHMNGLEGAAFFKRFTEGKRLTLISSPEVREVIWDQRLVASMGTIWEGSNRRTIPFGEFFEHIPLSWEGVTVVGPFRIRARRTRHPLPTSALLVEADGRLLGYSCDTDFDPELIDFLEPADLILHETGPSPVHASYSDLASLPEDLRSKMRLIHYPDDFDIEASTIRPVEQGEVLQP